MLQYRKQGEIEPEQNHGISKCKIISPNEPSTRSAIEHLPGIIPRMSYHCNKRL